MRNCSCNFRAVRQEERVKVRGCPVGRMTGWHSGLHSQELLTRVMLHIPSHDLTLNLSCTGDFYLVCALLNVRPLSFALCALIIFMLHSSNINCIRYEIWLTGELG